MKLRRTVATTCAIAASALLTGVVAPTSNAATGIGVNGIGGGPVGNVLQGWPFQGTDERLDLAYRDAPFGLDSSIVSGVRALVALMGQEQDVDRLVGISQSALVIVAALREHPEIVPEGGLTVYLIGNPARERTGISDRYNGGFVPVIGLTHQGPIRQDIPGLTVLDVSFEYDGLSDSPDPRNLLAVINSLIGIAVLHANYGSVDMTASNIKVRQIGNTTQYLVPVKRLPILALLYAVGLGFVADAMDPGLRAIIDPAHDREGYVRQGDLQAGSVPGSVSASLRGNLHPEAYQPQDFSLDALPDKPESSAFSGDEGKTTLPVGDEEEPAEPVKVEQVENVLQGTGEEFKDDDEVQDTLANGADEATDSSEVKSPRTTRKSGHASSSATRSHGSSVRGRDGDKSAAAANSNSGSDAGGDK